MSDPALPELRRPDLVRTALSWIAAEIA